MGKSYNLEYNFYTETYPFLLPDATLADRYKGIESVFTSLPVFIDPKDKNQVLKEPYFSETEAEFVCPDINAQLSDEHKLSLIEYIFKHWQQSKAYLIQKIDWSEIDNIDTKQLLGFNPIQSVFPEKYAIADEQLPQYMINWISYDQQKIAFITDLKVNTENSLVVLLRRFFLENQPFPISKIASEGTQFQLFNTFIWLKETGLKLTGVESLNVFREMVAVINKLRNDDKAEELILEDQFDFQRLEVQSIELNDPYYLNWKESLDGKFSIYLFEGELPRIISIDEIEGYTFMEFPSGDVAISDDNVIYINALRKNDLKRILSGLVSGGRLTSDELLQLYQIGDETDKREGIFITMEEQELLDISKKIGSIEDLIQLVHLKDKVGNIGFRKVIEVGSQAFSNDGAAINSGNAGEKIVYEDLKKRFGAERVRWTSTENPNVDVPTNEYDFEVYDSAFRNVLYYVDSKSTTTRKYQADKTEIYWRNCEWKFMEDQSNKNYIIARVFNVNSTNPEIVYFRMNREEF